jgi:hypothetical protein
MRRLALLFCVIATACSAGAGSDQDSAVTAAPVAPAAQMPHLVGPRPARERATEFVRYAASSKKAELDELRAHLAEARDDDEVIGAIAERAMLTSDHSEALLSVALLGEMKSVHARRHLHNIVSQPLPAWTGEENSPRIDMEMLQSKAVDGLAYLHDGDADAEVLHIAGAHESRAVRAEAIDAYLYNHGDSDAARAALEAVVQPEDRIFLDRVRHVEGETAAEFDAKLARFLEKHPEVVPPAPVPEAHDDQDRHAVEVQ